MNHINIKYRRTKNQKEKKIINKEFPMEPEVILWESRGSTKVCPTSLLFEVAITFSHRGREYFKR